MNGMEAYPAPRARSATIMSRLRSKRSTNTPANGPNRIEGSSRASMTPVMAYPARAPPILVTRAVTATKPTQSPSDDTSIARHRREKDLILRTLPKVAGRVPRSAATSSAMLATTRLPPSRPPRLPR